MIDFSEIIKPNERIVEVEYDPFKGARHELAQNVRKTLQKIIDENSYQLEISKDCKYLISKDKTKDGPYFNVSSRQIPVKKFLKTNNVPNSSLILKKLKVIQILSSVDEFYKVTSNVAHEISRFTKENCIIQYYIPKGIIEEQDILTFSGDLLEAITPLSVLVLYPFQANGKIVLVPDYDYFGLTPLNVNKYESVVIDKNLDDSNLFPMFNKTSTNYRKVLSQFKRHLGLENNE